MAYDEAILTKSDAVLAAALWRNVFAGAWAGSISVDGNKAPVGQKKLDISQADVEAQKAELKRLGITPAPSAAPSESNSEPNVTASDSSAHQMEDPLSAIAEQAQFAVSLEKLVVWMRRETYRLDNLSDTFVAAGKLVDRQSPTLDFTPISGGLGQVASAKK